MRVLAGDVPPESRIALATFVVDAPGMTQENVARALSDVYGLCVSGGYHCTHVASTRERSSRERSAPAPMCSTHARKSSRLVDATVTEIAS